MSENPFAEPGDPDRTIIRPMPGGTRAARPARPAVAPDAMQDAVPPTAAGPDLEQVQTGTGPLAAAAAPLLQLLARLRNAATAPDPGDMRERTRRELRAFERRAKGAKVPADQLRLAHYALCAALDDVVLNLPWGTRGRWHDQPLAVELHGDSDAGRGFFDQLRRLRDTMPASLPVVELMFMCLSLGMMGPYRAAADGLAQLERVRHRVFELVVASAPVPAALSDQAAGVDAPAAPRRGGVPVWVGASVAAAALAGLYALGLNEVNAASDEVYQAAMAAPPSAMPALVRPAATPPPPKPPPAPPGAAEHLQAALAGIPEVEVLAMPAAAVVRIPAHLLFPRPNATLGPATPLDRVAQALRGQAGAVQVLAYTDNLPTHTVAFPSNFALSVARAKAVRAALVRILPSARVSADGRADADPVAPNGTADGRERNRRVDIVVAREP